MLETGLKQWLDREESPSDFYQLIGQPRLCGNRDRLLGCLEEASEYLFQYQNHKDKRVRDRARQLSRQLAEARRTLSDESRWQQYDSEVIFRLRTLYRKNPDFSGPNPKLEDLKRWLALIQQVDPTRVDDLVATWTSESAPPTPRVEPQPKTSKPEMETLSQSSGQTAELPKIRERRDKPHSSGGTHEGASVEFSTYRLAETSSTPQEARSIPSVRRAPPPPPGGKLPGGTREMKAPPPPPPKESLPHPPTLPQIRPIVTESRSAEFPRSSPGALPGSPALWIVLASFLAALILGMFGLVIAWAAGAFDDNRSRGGICREEPLFVLETTPTTHPPSPQRERPTRSVNRRDLSTTHSA